ncbi:aldehyde dehydrogenase family domain-containing protein [Cordyceps javanica]|uniref:Aldehyde dehydrogenase family domain-containing protein n=1 Tax=Cordyceps javanica TaxID=43265 RepID=A0A545V252_9HYPO|nr:aldehyde dehydrogenase family domain-containing protein [Cordyceps javanica]
MAGDVEAGLPGARVRRHTVVLKAAEQMPLSVLVLGELVRAAGFPPGVVKVAFTGSTGDGGPHHGHGGPERSRTSRSSRAASWPLLVLGDADMEQAVRWAHFGIMSNHNARKTHLHLPELAQLAGHISTTQDGMRSLSRVSSVLVPIGLVGGKTTLSLPVQWLVNFSIVQYSDLLGRDGSKDTPARPHSY